jgi:hypothetical protein
MAVKMTHPEHGTMNVTESEVPWNKSHGWTVFVPVEIKPSEGFKEEPYVPVKPTVFVKRGRPPREK